MDLSIIIPMFNSEKHIANAIRSVLDQDPHGLEFEIIVVDDKSTDNSCRVVESIGSDKIRLIRQDVNRGTAAARNAGIRQAKGTWIQFLDSDDRLDKALFRMLEISDEVDIDCYIYSAIVEFHDRLVLREVQSIKDKRSIGYLFAVWNLLIRRARICEFNESFSFEDVVFLFDMIRTRDLKIKILTGVFYHYNCMNTTSKMANFNKDEYRKMFIHLYDSVESSDRLTKMFFLETFVGIVFWNVVPLSLRLRIASKTLMRYFKYLPAVLVNGVRGHVRNTVTYKNA